MDMDMDIDPVPYRESSTPFIFFRCVCGSRLHAYSFYPIASQNFDPNFDPQAFIQSLISRRPLPNPAHTWYVSGRLVAVVDIHELQAFNQAHDHDHEPVRQASPTLKRLTEIQILTCLRQYRYHKLEPKEEGEVCAVCLADFQKDDKITVLQCEHRFHYECIEEWLLRNNVCPLCKRPALNLLDLFL